MKPPDRTATSDAATTRERVLAVVVEHGPTTAGEVARVLGLTAAAVRRHLEAMDGEGLVVEQAPPVDPRRGVVRGPGRPAKSFVAAPRASRAADGHGDLALDLLEHLAATAGREGVRAYAGHRAARLRERYAPEVEAAGADVPARARALALALGRDGYAASTRPVDTGTGVAAVQLCQGRCPVHRAAQAFPEICEAETTAFSELLGVGTRRLATLRAGGRVCTTHVPTAQPVAGWAGPTTGPSTRPTEDRHDDLVMTSSTTPSTTASTTEGPPR